jgi:hypothetical protein
MNFKLVSKQNMGAVLFLLLVIIISQSRLFDFLFYTSLGRAFFILFLLIIAYLNKILGVVTVLLAILMINNREQYSYFEGFTDPSGNNMSDPSGNTITKSSIESTLQQKKSNLESAIQTKQSQDPSGNIAAEGFDILGTENNLKRGKKSNSIPVSNSSRKSGNVDPYYHSSFDNSYSYF